MLQTYATCRLLKELGHEVELIDLRQPEPIKLRQLILFLALLNFIGSAKVLPVANTAL